MLNTLQSYVHIREKEISELQPIGYCVPSMTSSFFISFANPENTCLNHQVNREKQVFTSSTAQHFKFSAYNRNNKLLLQRTIKCRKTFRLNAVLLLFSLSLHSAHRFLTFYTMPRRPILSSKREEYFIRLNQHVSTRLLMD